jgi:hypothetical protein
MLFALKGEKLFICTTWACRNLVPVLNQVGLFLLTKRGVGTWKPAAFVPQEAVVYCFSGGKYCMAGGETAFSSHAGIKTH